MFWRSMRRANQICAVAVLCCAMILIIPQTINAFPGEVMNYFLDGGVRTLGRGGIAPIDAEPEALSLDDPYSLRIAARNRYRIDATYEYQRILRLYDGGWQGTKVASDALETVIAAPYSFLEGDLNLVAAAGYKYEGQDINATNQQEKVEINSNQRFNSGRAGFLASWRGMLSAALTLDANEYSDSIQLPFEVKVTPSQLISFGYKQGYHHLKNDIALTISGKNGAIPFSYTQNQRQLYFESKLWDDQLYLRVGVDPGNTSNLEAETKIKLPHRLYVVSSIRQWKEDMRQPFTLAAGIPGGHIDAFLKQARYRIGMGWDITEQWNVETNYVSSRLEMNGGGVANARAVVDFWPSMIVGNYNYLYAGGMKVDQLNVAAEYKKDRLSLEYGLQYLQIKPSFDLNYWRSILFGFGRAGEDNISLTTDSIDMIGLFLGFRYRLGPATFQYALGQFIPVATHEKDGAGAAGGGAADSGGGDKKNLFEQISDKISNHPGGLIQRLQLTVEF